MYFDIIKILKSDRKNIISNTTGIPNAVIASNTYFIGIDLSEFKI